MSHMIDMTTGKAAVAYVGETPWHGLGTKLAEGASLDEWRVSAGLNFEVLKAPVQYQNGGLHVWNERQVLYRSDTGSPLSVMSEGFNVHQPADIFALYAEIAKAAGFTLETAGSLSGGKRIWALAKVGDGADVVNGDRVEAYILLATAFDGSTATTAKFTPVRVVCNNTIEAALQGGGDDDTEGSVKRNRVKVYHATKWDEDVAKRVRLDLGIVHDAFERFMVESRDMANQPMNPVEASAFATKLMRPHTNKEDVRDSKGYKRIMELFNGAAIGSQMAGLTRWGMLNAVTQMIDHERGSSDNSRLESAWFGTGNAIKTRAQELLIEGEFSVVA